MGLAGGLALVGLLYSIDHREQAAAKAYASSLQTIDAVVEETRPFNDVQYESATPFHEGQEVRTPLLVISARHGDQVYQWLLEGEHPLQQGDRVEFQVAPSPRETYGPLARVASQLRVDGFVDRYRIELAPQFY